MGLKQLFCLHSPSHSIKEVLEEVGFNPTDCSSFGYSTRCKYCNRPLDVKWHRRSVNLVTLPVNGEPLIHKVNAIVSPWIGAISVPFNNYTETVSRDSKP